MTSREIKLWSAGIATADAVLTLGDRGRRDSDPSGAQSGFRAVTANDARKAIQALLHVAEDGQIGPKTLQALTTLSGLANEQQWPAIVGHETGVQTVKASTFADPADVQRFRDCKAHGNSDAFCFKSGDNGIGAWGDDCSQGSGPAVALPPEVWKAYETATGQPARNARVNVIYGAKSVTAFLRDTMPHIANISNGARIDLNPDTCEALGIFPPAMVNNVRWQWAG